VDANPAAASSGDESDNDPQSAQPPPQLLSQPKSFGEAKRSGLGGCARVAELVMAMLPGSVEDERNYVQHARSSTSVTPSATSYMQST
jgi:hypothetical protein